jgi:hypothetical protein
MKGGAKNQSEIRMSDRAIAKFSAHEGGVYRPPNYPWKKKV